MVLVSIIFGDETVIDGAQHKPLEPVSFTLVYLNSITYQPSAWRNLGYIKNDPYGLFDPEENQEGNRYKEEHSIHKDHPAFVLDTNGEYHSQITVALCGMERIQNMNGNMKIHPPWVKGSYCLRVSLP